MNEILIFTSGTGEAISKKATELCRKMGFKKSYWLCGGNSGWSFS